ncbi:MAG TPA: NUDIX hydrolase [Acidimicrobiales bacterium]|nr:NUDIX hydrolase [Acidimicrobiales bacterium]
MSPFTKRGEREVWSGAVISVVQGTFVSPSGATFERDVVHHPGAVAVVPVDGDEVVLVRQYRAAVDLEILEIPAGKRDVAGEAPELTAHRELAEEVGLTAGRLVKLAEFYNSIGFSDELSHVFLGTELSPVPDDRQGEEEEHMTVERIRLDDVPALVAAGELVDAKTVIGLLMAREHLA